MVWVRSDAVGRDGRRGPRLWRACERRSFPGRRTADGALQAALDAATSGSARAHGPLLGALEGRTIAGEGVVGGLVEEASELLRCVWQVLRCAAAAPISEPVSCRRLIIT